MEFFSIYVSVVEPTTDDLMYRETAYIKPKVKTL